MLKNVVTLKSGVRVHSRSLKVVSVDRPCMVSYKCSLVSLSLKRTVLRYSTDLENQVRGLSRSLEISPVDRAHKTSY